MKIAITQIKFDLRQGNVLDVDVHEPGTPLHLMVVYDTPPRVLVTRDAAPPEPVPIPVLLVQIDPTAPTRRRRYVACASNTVIDTAQFGVDRLDFVATVINPNDGRALALFEVPSDQIAAMDATAAAVTA